MKNLNIAFLQAEFVFFSKPVYAEGPYGEICYGEARTGAVAGRPLKGCCLRGGPSQDGPKLPKHDPRAQDLEGLPWKTFFETLMRGGRLLYGPLRRGPLRGKFVTGSLYRDLELEIKGRGLNVRTRALNLMLEASKLHKPFRIRTPLNYTPKPQTLSPIGFRVLKYISIHSVNGKCNAPCDMMRERIRYGARR